MVLEATMIVIDNSEYMRNGDYMPTRWDAQSDAVNIVFDVKINSNAESRVGLITMAGKRAELLASLTQDLGKIIGALHGSKLGGQSDLASGINIAQLALKHRENKSLRQRILILVGSPIPDVQEDLVKLGKRLKKNNVAIDIVSFGEIEENESKLAAFIESVNSGDNS
jgi:26S proteasome regulatory subunit N10